MTTAKDKTGSPYRCIECPSTAVAQLTAGHDFCAPCLRALDMSDPQCFTDADRYKQAMARRYPATEVSEEPIEASRIKLNARRSGKTTAAVAIEVQHMANRGLITEEQAWRALEQDKPISCAFCWESLEGKTNRRTFDGLNRCGACRAEGKGAPRPVDVNTDPNRRKLFHERHFRCDGCNEVTPNLDEHSCGYCRVNNLCGKCWGDSHKTCHTAPKCGLESCNRLATHFGTHGIVRCTLHGPEHKLKKREGYQGLKGHEYIRVITDEKMPPGEARLEPGDWADRQAEIEAEYDALLEERDTRIKELECEVGLAQEGARCSRECHETVNKALGKEIERNKELEARIEQMGYVIGGVYAQNEQGHSATKSASPAQRGPIFYGPGEDEI